MTRSRATLAALTASRKPHQIATGFDQLSQLIVSPMCVRMPLPKYSNVTMPSPKCSNNVIARQKCRDWPAAVPYFGCRELATWGRCFGPGFADRFSMGLGVEGLLMRLMPSRGVAAD